MNYLNSLYQQVLLSISIVLSDCEKQVKDRRKMNLIILILSILFGKEIKLIVDGTILRVANIYRAQTRKIKRVAGKKFWAKRKRNIYSWDYQREDVNFWYP
jgi:hypothetical protein